jgi:hypothetical protein
MDRHRIFLPQELCDSLEAFAKEVRWPAMRYGTYLKIEYPSEQTTAETDEQLQALHTFVEVDVPRMRLAIEEEFLRLLGVMPS